MALSADNVNVAVTGKIYAGATTATAPTSAVSALTAFTELGYVSADGITISQDRTTNQIRAWQNSDLVREVTTEATTTYSFTLLESTKEVIELYFGSTMTAGKVQVNPGNTGGTKSFVIDVVDGSDAIRHYLPLAEVTNVDSQTFANGEAISYTVTITAYAKAGRVADVYYGALAA